MVRQSLTVKTEKCIPSTGGYERISYSLFFKNKILAASVHTTMIQN